jgi:predicted ATP-dependent endonuclease of OLD family
MRNTILISSDGKTINPSEADQIFEDSIDSYFYENDRTKEIRVLIDNDEIIAKFTNFVENHLIDQESNTGKVTLTPTDKFDTSSGKVAFGVGSNEKPNYLKFWGYPFNPLAIKETKNLRFILPTDIEPINYEDLYNQILISKKQKVFQRLSSLVFGSEIGDLRQFTETSSKKKYYRVSDLKGDYKRIGEFGYGTNRMLKIFLLLLCSEGNPVFIDEVDNGIHFSKQDEFWRFIFEISKDLNVQIFATTHSRDCFDAFARVSNENPGEGQFIRLQERGGEIKAVSYNETERMRAVEFKSEVR